MSPLLDDQVFVSIDLETTGLNQQSDEIIEIGAVKFRGTEELDTFRTLINPHRSLPSFITLLTGIHEEELTDAPSLGDVGGDLREFVGDAAILGQNVAFDIGFLKEKGIEFSGPVYDTLEMALILLPRFPEHGLSAMATALGVSLDSPHRALADAYTTMRVFHKLLDRIETLQPPTLQAILPLTSNRDWPFGRLLQAQAEQAATGEDRGVQGLIRSVLERMDAKSDTSSTLHPRLVPEPADADAISDMLSPGGALARSRNAFEDRPQQREMAVQIAHSFNQGLEMIIEAGAGTGKSLAYLIPALSFALANERTVVIATSTRGLQEQLLTKDVPDALLAFQGKADEMRIATLKGQGNYLCLHRLATRLQRPDISIEEAKFLLRLIVWLEESVSGDQGELNLWVQERRLWELVSAWDGRGGFDCPYRKRGACFVNHARRLAQGAHVVLTNHAFLLADAARGSGFLSHATHLILDEAHHLEDEATSQFGDKVTQSDVVERLNRLRDSGTETMRLGARAHDAIAAKSLAPARIQDIDSIAAEVDDIAERTTERVLTLFTTLTELATAATRERSDYEQRFRFTPETQSHPQWRPVAETWEDVDAQFQSIDRALGRLLAGVEDADDQGLLADISAEAQATRELRTRLKTLLLPDTTEDIRWLTQRQNSDVILERAPLNVGPSLREHLFAQKDSIVLTSATMSISRTFSYMQGRLGLEEAETLLLKSPFDYRNAASVYIPTDMPDPNSPQYNRAIERTLVDVVAAAEGHALALFTSYAALRAAYTFVKPALDAYGIGVLAQGINGQPARLLDIFRNTPKALLLGTGTFWEGVDLAGDSLRLLVMTRLPFRVPTDPIFAARSEMFDDPFSQMAVPEAILRFRQGFGRLIRTREDQGAVVLLDNRLLTKGYGQMFIDSLPDAAVTKPRLSELPDEVAAWLGDAKFG